MTSAIRMRWLAAVLAGLWVVALAPGGTGYATERSRLADHDPVAVRSGPAPLPRTGFLSGVACVSAADCVAVGDAISEFLNNVPTRYVAERWNGRGWTPLASPTAPVSAVACPRARSCQAVGLRTAERWNGRAWIPEKTPAVRTARVFGVGVVALSCPAVTACVAVGTRADARRNLILLAETWNGSAWAAHNPVTPAGAVQARLSAVSCTGRSACIAVGSYHSSAGLAALAEKWNGRTWTQLALPSIGTSAGLNGVSCVSSRSCVAVGSDTSGGLAESWNGTTWTVMPAPAGAATAVSCTSAANCMAIDGDTVEPSAMSWNGSKWKALSLPPSLPAKLSTLTLGAVSCPAAKTCMAVGGSNDGSFAMSWNGSAWRGLRVNRGDVLSGVSCTAATRCMAPGSYETAAGKLVTLTESWNGSSWHRHPASQAAESVLSDVSCRSATSCIAVGAIGDSATLAEAWNGSAWRPKSGAGIPGQFPTGLSTVSCRGTTCLALDAFFAEAWVWNGAAWQATADPDLPQNGGLVDVSCASPVYCMAVGGNLVNPDEPPVPLAALWNGTSWHQFNPSGSSTLNTVSCTSASFCVAAGFNFADIWNGTSWRMLKLPGTFGIGGPGTIYGGRGISAVSCASASACMAVGNYLIRAGSRFEGVNVAEHWNGTSWRRLPTAGPGGGLTDVSCTSKSRCVAVGVSATEPAGTRLLAERWNGKRWLLLTTPNP